MSNEKSRETGIIFLKNEGELHRTTGIMLPKKGDDTIRTTGIILSENDGETHRTTGIMPSDGMEKEGRRDTIIIPKDQKKDKPGNTTIDETAPGKKRVTDIMEKNSKGEVFFDYKSGAKLQGQYDTYTITEPMHAGGQAKVYFAESGDAHRYVLKIYNQNMESKYHDDIVNYLSKTNMDGIPTLIDYGITIDVMGCERYFYVYPVYEGDFENKKEDLPKTKEEKYRYISILTGALHDMHAHGIIHADIKPDNILFDPKRNCPVICDFGSITKIDTLLSDLEQDEEMFHRSTGMRKRGTEGYTAPEIYYRLANDDAKYTAKVDFFSLGVTFSEIFNEINGAAGRQFRDNYDLMDQIQNGQILYKPAIARDGRLVNLIDAMLFGIAKYRAGYKEIKKWLNGESLEISATNYLEKKKPFDYYFNKKHYFSLEELSLAYAESTNAAIEDIFNKESLKDALRIVSQEKYSKVMDCIKNGWGEEYRSAKVFEVICILNPDIPFFWNDKIYTEKNGGVAQLAEDICDAVESQSTAFDSLFSTGAILTFFKEKGDNEGAHVLAGLIKKSGDIKEKKGVSRAALMFAECISPGILMRRIMSEALNE